MSNLLGRLDNLRQRIQDPEFLEGKGLSKEVNIHIFCYDPEEEMTVRYFIDKLTSDKHLACKLKEFNLFKVLLSICEKRKIINKIAGLEEKKGSEFLLNQLKRIANNKEFAKTIAAAVPDDKSVILITGVGEAYPFIRTHALLEALQLYFTNNPIVVMYPGKYDGYNLSLFNKLPPESYYRAFKIIA